MPKAVLEARTLAAGARRGWLAATAGWLAESPLLARGKALWEKNQQDRNLPLSRLDKLRVGAHLILKDYSQGLFPPTFTDQQQVYQGELNYRNAVPGCTPEEVTQAEMVKPFWRGRELRHLLTAVIQVSEFLEAAGVRPPARLLELGGGTGWMAEFLAQMRYRIVSTTLSPDDVASGRKRAESLRVKGVQADLEFVAAPMETVADHVKAFGEFDAVFVCAALHHAFDWRQTIASSCQCLKPGGWLLICEEPNVLHTAISYRVARLTNTHEIGFSKRELVGHLRRSGFRQVISSGKRPHFFCRDHWLRAQK